MQPTDTPSRITASRLRALTSTYATHVPEKLKALDTFRLDTLPSTLHARNATSSAHPSKHITQTELQKLVTWKLSRGKFRPTLAKLVASNAAPAVADTTARAFAAYDAAAAPATTKESGASEAAKARKAKAREQALALLTGLRGVGPATASLVLAVYDPVDVPFFSDELFAWLATTAGAAGGADVRVWQGKMAYNVKEYRLLCERVDALRARLREEEEEKDGGTEIGAVDVEHAAWMIVKGGLGTDAEGPAAAAKEGAAESSKSSDESRADARLPAQGSKKRSAPPAKPATQPSKKSKKR